MFTMDIPYAPAQETPIVLAQADTSGASPQPDYILKYCKETESTGDSTSAFNTLSPAAMLYNYFQSRGRNIESTAVKSALLESTGHGRLNASVSGRSFMYVPEPNYIGNDKAVFIAEFEGKRYKILVNLVVSLSVGESPLLPGEKPVCPAPQLIEVKKPSKGSSGHDLNFVSAISPTRRSSGTPQKRGAP